MKGLRQETYAAAFAVLFPIRGVNRRAFVYRTNDFKAKGSPFAVEALNLPVPDIIPSVLLVLVAAVQIYLVDTANLKPWKGEALVCSRSPTATFTVMFVFS